VKVEATDTLEVKLKHTDPDARTIYFGAQLTHASFTKLN